MREVNGSGVDEIRCNCGIDFSVLPEDCIAAIISLTSPRDACRSALVSKIFQSAADSDVVWGSFLRPDYKEAIARLDESVEGSLTGLVESLSKKQLFLRLSQPPLLIDGGNKSFALEMSTGKKCYMLSPRSLFIMWMEDPKYWTFTSMEESRFQEVAKLIDVCWLEIRGKIKASMLSPSTIYVAYLVYKMSQDYYGFNSLPVNVSVGTTKDNTNTGIVSLDTRGNSRRRRSLFSRWLSVMPMIYECPKQRRDDWLEVEIGEFYIQGDEDGDVEMALWEVEAGNRKCGLLVQGIEIRPKVV